MMANETEVPKASWKPAIYGLLLVLSLWGLTFISFIFGDDLGFIHVGDRGTFGDMFGGLNALFSGLAFAGIILTIYMQRRELEFQREELRLTRITLNAQRKEMSAQNKTLKLQQFENTFFSMLRVLNDIVNSIDLRAKGDAAGPVISTGRDSFQIFMKQLVKTLKSPCGIIIDEEPEDQVEAIKAYYQMWWREHRKDLGHYFRTLYNLIKFIDEFDMSFSNKKKYTRIVRAQLSDQEQVLLFYNCLSDIGEGFKKNVIQYALIKQVPSDLLVKPAHKQLYPAKVFRDSKV